MDGLIYKTIVFYLFAARRYAPGCLPAYFLSARAKAADELALGPRFAPEAAYARHSLCQDER